MKKTDYLELYYQMVLIRRLEEKSAELYQQGKIGGFLHLYIGQEAVSTGLIAARKPEDRVITAYRDHGVAINAGISSREVMAELLGKATGVSKGKGGSMHMADVSKNYWGGHAVVGSHLPIAAGLALGDQYMNHPAVTICLFGDGATNIGYFHEALNLSKVWNLPVLWVCENNKYGMGTAVERASAVPEMRQKAEGYGMANDRINGMDVLEVQTAAKKYLEFCRSGKGPFFLEIVTYRYRGHSMGDPERYREKQEIEKWQTEDPIGIYHKHLLEKEIASEAELKDVEMKVIAEVEDAVEFAESSPEPDPQDLFAHIYAEDQVRIHG